MFFEPYASHCALFLDQDAGVFRDERGEHFFRFDEKPGAIEGQDFHKETHSGEIFNVS